MRALRLACVLLSVPGFAVAAEQPVAAYAVSDSNAGAAPFADGRVYAALHGRAGIERIVARFNTLNREDPRTRDIFAAMDVERLHRTLVEQLCYLAGGPCHYTGRDMAAAHKDMGLQSRDFAAVVEHLQSAMDAEHVGFHAQNRLLGKLAPMHRTIVAR